MKETFLCAKYSYKDDIAVKQKEAFEDGQKDGIIKGKIEGSQQKAIEIATKSNCYETSCRSNIRNDWTFI